MTDESPPPQSIPKIITLSQIEQVTASSSFQKSLISAIANGFQQYSAGKFNACPIQTMGAPPLAPFSCATDTNKPYAAQTCVKSGYLTGDDIYVLKVASGGSPFPCNSGSMQVYSQHTGQLQALILDEGILTEMRTAAVGAVAAQYLAPKVIRCVGVMGTGVQARFQLQYLQHVILNNNDENASHECEIMLWGRSADKVNLLKQELEQQNVWKTTSVAPTPNELLRACDVIVTTTSSREPLLGTTSTSGNELVINPKGLHITCIGADAPGKIELDPTLVQRAELLVADCRKQTVERGEFQEAIRQGLVNVDTQVVELGTLSLASDPKNSNLCRQKIGDGRLTVFDSSGVAVQDCVVAKMTLEALPKKK